MIFLTNKIQISSYLFNARDIVFTSMSILRRAIPAKEINKKLFDLFSNKKEINILYTHFEFSYHI